MSVYKDNWSSWKNVAKDFADYYSYDSDEDEKALKDFPEPEEVLLAAYSYEDYSGSAWVVFRNGDKYYIVSGGHCSCNGLEGQWEPEIYESAELLLSVLEKGGWYYGVEKKYVEEVKEKLRKRING